MDLEAISKEKEKQIRSGTPAGDKPPSEKDTKKLAAMATVSTQIEEKKPCPPKGRDPESKVAWVKKNYPLCIDNGAFYDNVLQIIGLALSPLIMIAMAGGDDGHTDTDGDGVSDGKDDDDDNDGTPDSNDNDNTLDPENDCRLHPTLPACEESPWADDAGSCSNTEYDNRGDCESQGETWASTGS